MSEQFLRSRFCTTVVSWGSILELAHDFMRVLATPLDEDEM
jgi:hypothetical protein